MCGLHKQIMHYLFTIGLYFDKVKNEGLILPSFFAVRFQADILFNESGAKESY